MSPSLQYCFDLLMLSDQKALDVLMLKYGSTLRYFAFKKVRDKDVAEDIVSEAYCKLWFNRTRLKSSEHLKAFLYLVTNNACLDYLKSHAVKYKVTDPVEGYESIKSDDDFLSEIFYAEFVEKLIKLSERLPKMQFEVFKLSVIEGLETKEICERLQTSESTVYFSKSKAISFIRNALTREELASFVVYLGVFLGDDI